MGKYTTNNTKIHYAQLLFMQELL